MIIFRYLSKELYASVLAITLVLLIIFITNAFVHYLKVAATGKITILAVLEIMTLQVPILLGYLLPLGLYLGILLVFGRLYMDHEMTVLSACGVSRASLLGMALLIGLVVMIFDAWLMLWVEPIVQGYRASIENNSIVSLSLEKVVPKRFQSLGHGSVFYAGKLSRSHHQMTDVFLAERGKSEGKGKPYSWDITTAKKANVVTMPHGGGKFLVFDNGYRYIGAPGEKNYQVAHYAQYGFRLTKAHNDVSYWPFDAPTWALWLDSKHNLKAAAMLQWRFALPISVLILVLLAVPLSRINPRQGKFARLIPAILIYVVYADLMFLGRAWIRKGVVSPSIGLFWIHGLMLLLALGLIAHEAGWKRMFRWQQRRYLPPSKGENTQ